MKLLNFLLVFLILIPLTSGLQFYPASLEFNIEKGDESCKDISFELDSHTTVFDVWASDYSIPWSVSGFGSNSESLGLTVNYLSDVNKEDRDLSFCISALDPGEYKGALVFSQEAKGNSVVQFAVWLNVLVSGDAFEKEPKKSRGSRGSSNGDIIYVPLSKNIVGSAMESKAPEINEFSEEGVVLNSPIQRKGKVLLMIPALMLMSFVLLVVFLTVLLAGRRKEF